MPSATYGFNGKPNSVQKGASGSYTIPASNFAWVTLSCKNGGTITLDGTTALASDGSTWNAIARLRGNHWSTTTGEADVGTTASGTTGQIETGTLASVTVSPVYTNSTAAAYNAVSIGLWVPTGTVISGTGNYSYTASLFTG